MKSDKYLQYMKNVGGRISVGAFNDDWEPIGGTLLDRYKTKEAADDCADSSRTACIDLSTHNEGEGL